MRIMGSLRGCVGGGWAFEWGIVEPDNGPPRAARQSRHRELLYGSLVLRLSAYARGEIEADSVGNDVADRTNTSELWSNRGLRRENKGEALDWFTCSLGRSSIAG